MRERIDIKYVYLNDDLEIVDANREFYVYFDLVGHEFNTIDDFVPPGSKRALLSLIKNKNKENNYSVIKFMQNHTVPKNNIVQVYGSVFDGIQTSCLKIIDIEQCLKVFRSYRLEDTELIYSLSITDDCIFSYWQGDNVFKMTQFYQNRKVILFEQNIDEWAATSIEKKLIPKDQISTFKNFIETLKRCPKNLDITFESGLRTSNPNILESLSFTGVRFVDDEEIAIVGRILPLESAKKAKQSKKIIEEIQIDPLAKVYNKKTITSYAQKIIDEHRNEGIALIIIDLDHFKPVNDAYGHMTGDKILEQTGEILREIVGDIGIVGRYGGDEFLIIANGLSTELLLRGFLNSIREKIAKAFRGKFDEINITCSLGAAVYPQNGQNYDELFQKADFCLYRAKNKGRNRYVFFRDDLHGKLFEKAIKATDGIKYDDREIQELRHMSEFVHDIAFAKDKAINRVMQHVLKTYNLDNITMYSGKEMKTAWYIGKKLENLETANYIKSESFKNLLADKTYFRMDFIENLPDSASDIREIIEKNNIKSSIQCILGTPENITGLVIFNRLKQAALWAEYEENCVILVASTLNLLQNSTNTFCMDEVTQIK